MLMTREDRRSRACSELRRGAPIILRHNTTAALVLSAEMITERVYRLVRQLSLEPGVIAVSDRRAETLKARVYDGDLARIVLTDDHSVEKIRAIADPALALSMPMIGPHHTARGGTIDAHRAGIALCKRARLLPAVLVFPFPSTEDAETFKNKEDLADLWTDESQGPDAAPWEEIVSARVPIEVAAHTRLRIFKRQGWDDEHYALEIGDPNRAKPVLTRLHSACVTGDLFGSMKCDCGPQLRSALAQIAAEGSGVLVYLLQEGRGIGLVNKMRAYRLQDEGFDTVEANHRLGFKDDERLLTDGGEILRTMGFSQARLMTNNPRKVVALTDVGIDVVERVSVITEANPENERYLDIKRQKSGHLL